MLLESEGLPDTASKRGGLGKVRGRSKTIDRFTEDMFTRNAKAARVCPFLDGLLRVLLFAAGVTTVDEQDPRWGASRRAGARSAVAGSVRA